MDCESFPFLIGSGSAFFLAHVVYRHDIFFLSHKQDWPSVAPERVEERL